MKDTKNPMLWHVGEYIDSEEETVPACLRAEETISYIEINCDKDSMSEKVLIC